MKSYLSAIVPLLVAATASATVTLPKFYTPNMVVQRNAVLTIPGHAAAGSTVTASTTWSDLTVSTKADADGRFVLQLPTPDAGGPYDMLFDDGDGPRLRLTNVLSGDVWICSGQSNMEMNITFSGLMNGVDEAVTAIDPDVRMLQVKKAVAYGDRDDCEVNNGGWVDCNPESVINFSALAFNYGRRLRRELGVPIGVIECCWGGTVCEAWSPVSAFEGVAGFEPQLDLLAKCDYDDAKVAAYADNVFKDCESAIADGGKAFDPAKFNTSWQDVPVPAYWESYGYPDLDGFVWLQREVEIPAEAAGKQASISVGYVDDVDATYFNGTLVGSTVGHNMHRLYSVDPTLVKAGKNVVSVRVRDNGAAGGTAGTPSDYYMLLADGQRLELAGDWKFRVVADFSQRPDLVTSLAVGSANFPTVLYNAMLEPLHVMPAKGVIWYQGESNAGRAQQYSDLFKNMITGWRNLWGNPDMPFYFVQLAAFTHPRAVDTNSTWAALRQAQANALVLPNTGMITAVDLGHPTDIHPRNKQEVARRLAELALDRTYDIKFDVDAPAPVQTKFDKDNVVFKFDKTLKPASCAIQGFTVAGDDGRFYVGHARLVDDKTIEVSTPEVTKPAVVRYLWANYPLVNLFGENGLPVLPFATDNGGIK